MGSRLALVALSLSFLAAAGCGGAADSDLFGTPPSGNGVDAGSDATATDSGRDTGPDVTPPPFDAAPDVLPPPSSAIACGGTLNPPKKCDSLTELCCRTGMSATYGYDCVADPQNCMNSGDVPFTCSRAENCVAQGFVGNVCCASLIANGNISVAYEVTCQPAAKCNQGNAKVVVCNPNAPNPCPGGGTCKLSTQTLPDYYLCL